MTSAANLCRSCSAALVRGASSAANGRASTSTWTSVPRQLPGRNCRFAARALRVESALACDQQAGAPESFFEADFPYEPGSSGLQVRPQERRQPEPEAARGAGAGDGRNVDAEISA